MTATILLRVEDEMLIRVTQIFIFVEGPPPLSVPLPFGCCQSFDVGKFWSYTPTLHANSCLPQVIQAIAKCRSGYHEDLRTWGEEALRSQKKRRGTSQKTHRETWNMSAPRSTSRQKPMCTQAERSLAGGRSHTCGTGAETQRRRTELIISAEEATD